MLFFKEIKYKKMADPGFKSLYAEECHICSLTLKVIERMESSTNKNRILSRLNISDADYDMLKKGDHCRPDQVKLLCRHLGIKTEDETACPRFESQ